MLDTTATIIATIFTTNDLGAGEDLLSNGNRHGFSVDVSVVTDAKVINDGLVAGNITTSSTKRFGEGTHQDIDVRRIHAEKVTNATAIFAKGANAVSFINIKVELMNEKKKKKKRKVNQGRLIVSTRYIWIYNGCIILYGI